MLNRPRMLFAAPGALILIIALAGGVLGANLLTTTGPTPESVTDPLVVDTTATWEDLDGNSVDDDCQETITPDAEAAAAAELALDANGDGTISVDEAARSERTGGLNCNHGGYVSTVAQETDAEDESDEDAEEAEAAPEVCEAMVVPTFALPAEAAPGAFGAYVSSIAQSDAVGGKNCNHGGAVSDAVHAAQEVAKAAREAAKAERAAARDAAQAERSAERAAAKAERDAAKAERKAAAPKPGKGNGGG